MSQRPRRDVRIDSLESRRLLTSVSFTVDSDLSYLTISATAHIDHAGTFSLKDAGDALDTANYDGTLVADISHKGVKFGGGSDISAIEHEGDFSPGGGDAAYAVDGKIKKLGISLAKVKAAVRDLTLDITNTSRKPLVGAKHRFQIRHGEVEATSGTVDYSIDSRFGDGDGSQDFAGEKVDLENGFGRLTGKKGSRVLTIPVEVRFTEDLDDGTGVFTLKGQIVGREQVASAHSVAPLAASFSAKAISTKRSPAADVLGTPATL